MRVFPGSKQCHHVMRFGDAQATLPARLSAEDGLSPTAFAAGSGAKERAEAFASLTSTARSCVIRCS